jgi:hypothetical protein
MTFTTGGNPGYNDMWVVGSLRFPSNGNCVFTPDGYIIQG